ncbi:M16 family metallopeptidase [Gaetbulibacter saemankumensis]|uniref:M16 family metallopeptidase n=1 Tax=Gaetbulibacter saemankumensis TaxID=311208 RepID=UPI000426AA28|nr:M16 family metallopeptidase [Gaetbulibacter saemankumensis]
MTRTFIFITSLIFSFNNFAGAQSLNYNDPLPQDETFKKGVLENGMTYYIKSTDVVKNAASYYIIQNVGSVLENDDQQGLAHFLEHMAFNGTKNFEGKEMLNTLQKYGAVFGKDVNAYTSFDETVYNLNNLPTTEDLIDTCLLVLHDWSNELLLTEEEIDAERGVIKEEWRTRQNGRMRLFETSMPISFNHSKYANRMPIGLMSVVEGFEYKALRDFYHDWYRTDLQAIAVIGDVNVEEIEAKIIKMFSDIPAVENPKERFYINIPDHEEMLYSLGTDPEISTASISFGIRHDKPEDEGTVGALKRNLLESIATNLINSRISEKSQNPDVPFLGGSVRFGGMVRTKDYFSVNVNPKPNQQKEAFKAILTEVQRVINYGYLQSEVDRAITKMKSSYENAIAKRDNKSHASIEKAIQANYLNNDVITDIEKEYEIAKQILDNISLEELHETFKGFYTENNRFVNVTGVEGQDNLTESDVKAIISAVENDKTIEPYSEALDGKTLISGVDITPGKIVKTEVSEVIGATTFTLSNGVTVHYKYVNKDKDQVTLNAQSYGGMSLLKDEDLPSADLVGNLVSMSGLGEFSSTDLKKVLAGKTASVNANISNISEGLTGRSNTKDVETMLQQVHLYFVKPRFDEQAYQVLQNNIKNYLLRRVNDVGEKMRDSMTVALYGNNNPKMRIFNEAYINDISFEKIKAIYKDRFANVADFDFYIVGDVQEENLKPLLEKYLASIPATNVKEIYKTNQAEWIKDRIDEDIYIPMEDPKANVNVSFKKEIEYATDKSIYTSVLGDMLQLRVNETVREAEGGAYSPRASARLSREPKAIISVSFNFDCNPELADKMVDIVKEELQKMADGDIKEEDLNKTRTNFLKEREQSKDRNSYDMALLSNFFKYHYNMNDPKNFDSIVKSMSKEDIQSIAKEVLKGGKSFEIIFKPKN